MVLFTLYVKEIKGAGHKNGDADGMSERTLSQQVFNYGLFRQLQLHECR